jgi:hypothetical protein
LGTATALIVTFLICGIWHGASWGFVIWGGVHGIYIACSVFYKPYQKKLHKALGIENTRLLKVWQVFVTFNMVSFTWVFFRANSLSDAFYVVPHLIMQSISGGVADVLNILSGSNWGLVNLGILCVSLGMILLAVLLRNNVRLFTRSVWFRWGVYFLLTIWTLLFQANGSADFLYLRF